jgi:hypothetical protein
MLDRNKKPLLIILTLVLVVIVTFLAVNPFGKDRSLPGTTRNVYYYDLNTGELFSASAGLIPPIDAPSGVLLGTTSSKAGVRAYVFGCGSCLPEDRHVAWIEMYDNEARKNLTEQLSAKTHPLASRMGPEAVTSHVAEVNLEDPRDVKWVGLNSLKGSSIVRQSALSCPDGSAAIPCMPDY